MTAVFPLSPAPAWYHTAGWTASDQPRNGIFYQGGTDPNLTHLTAGATSYEVRNYYGTVVSSGSMSAAATSLTPTTPSGGWRCGWYRIYGNGPSSDTLFGNAYWVTNFVVLNNDSRFIPTPTGDTTFFGYPINGDLIAKGVLGLGTSRMTITGAADPNGPGGAGDLVTAEMIATAGMTYWTNPGSQYLDPARQRYMWLQFPNGAVDQLFLGTPLTYLAVYCANGSLDGSKVFVESDSSSGEACTIHVYYPNNSTLVETWTVTSCADAQTQINAGSSYIKAFVQVPGRAAVDQAVAAVGNAKYQGVILTVSTLHDAYQVTRYEGPFNEPNLNAGPEVAHALLIFTASVHAGHPNAKSLGPAAVSVNLVTDLDKWEIFLAAGGGNNCDELSFHPYNFQTNGDLNLGNTVMAAFRAKLAAHGLASKPLWCTENAGMSTGALTCVYGIHHPRRSRGPILGQLIMEQHGIPRELNNMWYDVSHGFWPVPAWWENSDGSLEPYACLGRTLAEQTWGQTHFAKLTFPGLADNIFLGSIYKGSSAQTVVLVATSYIPGSEVTLNTSDAGPLTVTDSFGNQSTHNVSGGKVTVPVLDTPTYVTTSVGATVTVSTVNGWTHTTDVAETWTQTQDVNTGGFITDYPTQVGVYVASGAPPTTAAFTSVAGDFYDVERVLIWCGSVWQTNSTMLTFTVEKTLDGITWETAETVDVSADATAFQSGASSTNTGTQYETYWPEQWVFDVPLGGVSTFGIRINASATSYGGEPTAAADAASTQADVSQHLALQRVAVLGQLSGSTGELQCVTLGNH